VNSQTPPGRSLDDWLHIKSERKIKLRKKSFRERLNKETSSARGNQNDDECFIATAAYGTPHAQEIDTLRLVRDEILLHNIVGEFFISVYYQCSPPIADWISRKERRKEIVRSFIIEPSVRFSEYLLSQRD
jgi:hypothetical protein